MANYSDYIDPVVYDASRNVTVTGIISGGDIKPYSLFSFPSGTGTSGYVLATNEDGTTAWTPTVAGVSLGRIYFMAGV